MAIDKPRAALLVRVRPSLKAKLVDLAMREHRSLSQQVEFLLERCVASEMTLCEDSPDVARPVRKRRN